MATLQELTIKIGADTDGLDKLDQGLSKVRDAGTKVTSVGKSLTAGVTTPLVGLGVAAVTTAADFESSMNGVRAVTGATGADFEALEDQAKEMGSTTQFSASESAQAMEFLGMAGWDTTQIMDGLPDVLNLAAAGGLELADAADTASNIMSGFGLEAEEAGRVSDVLAEASASANTSVEQLGGGFTYVGPLASSAGMSLEETAATLGVLADAGIQGEQGGTALRGALSSLLDPTAQVQGVMDGLGVSLQDTDGAMRPFPDIMRDLEDAGADTADMMNIFGQEAGPAMLALMDRGADDVAAFTEELHGAEGAAGEMADIRMEGLQGQLKELQSATEGLLLAIADSGLLDTITSLATTATEWAQELAETNPALMRWAVIIGAVLAALGPLLIVIGMTITAVGKIGAVLKILIPIFRAVALAKGLFSAALWASPITWIILGIIALIAVIVLIIVYWDEIAAGTAAAWDWIVEKLGEAWEWIKATATSIWEGIKAFFEGLWEDIKSAVSSAWDSVTSTISSAWDSAVAFVQGGIDRVMGFIAGLSAIPGMVGGFFSNMVSTAVTWISNLISRAAAVPGQITSALGNLGSLLTGAGRSVIQGLINGIRGMISNVGSAMSNVASTIRSYLPFSPAEDGPLSGSGAPEVSGARIAETLGEGVMSELAAIDQAADALMAPLDDRAAGMRDMTRHIPSNVNASVRHSGSGGGGQTLTLDVTGADEEFKKVIRKIIRNGGGDTQRVLGQN